MQNVVFGCEYKINNQGKGKVVIKFDSIEEADWMIKQIGYIETQEIE